MRAWSLPRLVPRLVPPQGSHLLAEVVADEREHRLGRVQPLDHCEARERTITRLAGRVASRSVSALGSTDDLRRHAPPRFSPRKKNRATTISGTRAHKPSSRRRASGIRRFTARRVQTRERAMTSTRRPRHATPVCDDDAERSASLRPRRPSPCVRPPAARLPARTLGIAVRNRVRGGASTRGSRGRALHRLEVSVFLVPHTFREPMDEVRGGRRFPGGLSWPATGAAE